MEDVAPDPNEAWNNLPLGCVADFIDPGEVYVFALTCSSSLAAVHEIHCGSGACQSSAVLLPPG